MMHVSILMCVLRENARTDNCQQASPVESHIRPAFLKKILHYNGIKKTQNNTLATLKQGMTLSTKALSKPNEINIRSEKTVAYYWRRRILRRTHSLTTNNFNKALCWLCCLTCLQWNHDFLVLNLVRWVLSHHHFFCLSNFEKKCISIGVIMADFGYFLAEITYLQSPH